MACLAVCHDLIRDAPTTADCSLDVYCGESQDEVCLVSNASRAGVRFMGSTDADICVEVRGEPRSYSRLLTIEFDNIRRMMSVLVQHDGKYLIYSKGADESVLKKLNIDQEFCYITQIQKKFNDFSTQGLRTLCMAYREVSQAEVVLLESALGQSGTKAGEELLEDIRSKLENNLQLLGCSAVRDKLQDEVPELIEDLHIAGISVWMLTGDKLETAQSVAQTCRLTSETSVSVKLSFATQNEASNSLSKFKANFQSARDRGKGVVAFIEGAALEAIFSNSLVSLQFAALLRKCRSVVCCRVTPAQKALVVCLLRDTFCVMAVGDGGNDVSMIQKANVGVGILGLEGRQAAGAADFAIPEFKNLRRLLFVHGRWLYMRNSELMIYYLFIRRKLYDNSNFRRPHKLERISIKLFLVIENNSYSIKN